MGGTRSHGTSPAAIMFHEASQTAIQWHTDRFRIVPQLAEALTVPTPAVRKRGSAWTELPRPASAGTDPVGHVRLWRSCWTHSWTP